MSRDIDPDKMKSLSGDVWRYKMGEMVSLMIHLGDRLGLYKALDQLGPVTSEELAAKTGYHERWLLEWLRGQAAARLLDYHHPDRFELTDEGAMVLAVEDEGTAFAAGAFSGPIPHATLDKLADAFTTGIGLSYEELGPVAAHRTERMLGPWVREALVPQIIPALTDVEEKLRAGALVADVGCGGGIALTTMAGEYPNSRFHGYDPNSHAIRNCQQRSADMGLSNVETFIAGGEQLPASGEYDFILCFDCIHDMTHPDRVIRSVRQTLKSDGTWLIKDIRSHDSFEKNLENPMLALFYGFSVSACMSSALSEPGGAGLGTLGFNPTVARQMVTDAGFTRFVEHDFGEPANLYYEVRP
jgi:2-polyprenyl-3-methyl-5-hydroxy-6-metoxy-1,4-benzoquinol methylase